MTTVKVRKNTANAAEIDQQLNHELLAKGHNMQRNWHQSMTTGMVFLMYEDTANE